MEVIKHFWNSNEFWAGIFIGIAICSYMYNKLFLDNSEK
jgi:hypothetical protein